MIRGSLHARHFRCIHVHTPWQDGKSCTEVPLFVPYKALEKFPKALYGTTEGTCSARFYRPVMLYYRWIKNGFAGPNSFRGFQEICPRTTFYQSLQEYRYEHVTDRSTERQKIHSLDPFIPKYHWDLFLMISVHNIKKKKTKWNDQLKLKDILVMYQYILTNNIEINIWKWVGRIKIVNFQQWLYHHHLQHSAWNHMLLTPVCCHYFHQSFFQELLAFSQFSPLLDFPAKYPLQVL